MRVVHGTGAMGVELVANLWTILWSLWTILSEMVRPEKTGDREVYLPSGPPSRLNVNPPRIQPNPELTPNSPDLLRNVSSNLEPANSYTQCDSTPNATKYPESAGKSL